MGDNGGMLSAEGFYEGYLRWTMVCNSQREAYERMEGVFEGVYGRRRYKGWEVFKAGKERFRRISAKK